MSGILDRNAIDVLLAILTFPPVLHAGATFAVQWMLTVRTACVLAMQLLDSALVRKMCMAADATVAKKERSVYLQQIHPAALHAFALADPSTALRRLICGLGFILRS